MKYKLINTPNNKYNAKQQILINRGLKETDLNHYMNLTDNDINDPEIFGKELMQAGADLVLKTAKNESDICVIVDCDCDGYTSSAVLINYLVDAFPQLTEHIHWFMHEGKQHGLSDAMDWIEDIGPSLVIIPDAGSNDWNELDVLHKDGRDILILDHHEIEGDAYPNCVLINSQLPQYPNKELSGVGVTWQFCRYLDKIKGTNFAEWYYDLVALGNTGDMMSLKSFETRRLIFKGLEPANIHNPFMFEMWQKNMFKLTDTPTSWGVTFYIVPFVNAITRSGTLEEKELIFSSMLKHKAFEKIPSNKRGHKPGELERVVDQAVRTCTNVKNRQSRAEEAGLELVEHLIKDNHMMEHKVLLFLLEPNAIKAEIRGLIANKLMARYQRPCCMLTKVERDGVITFEGSARGCDKVGVTEFKDICAETGVCNYTIGHQGAFGLGITWQTPGAEEIAGENIYQFLDKTDEILKDMSDEPIYYVDYIWSAKEADPTAIIDVAEMAPYWGKDMDEALVAVQGIQITKEMITMMKSNTVKITLPNGVSIIKFHMPDEEYNKLVSENGYVEINAVAKCNKNEWNGNVSAQLLLEDYEIVGGCAYVF